MWRYRALNKKKEERCLREGIDENMRDRYNEFGDASPLFRCVSSLSSMDPCLLSSHFQLCYLNIYIILGFMEIFGDGNARSSQRRYLQVVSQ